MNCNEFQSQLDLALEERHPPNHPALSGHASSCAECQRLWEDWLLLERAVGVWKDRPETIEVDLTDRVLDAARRDGLVSSNGVAVANAPTIEPAEADERRRSIWPLVVTAALVLLAALVVFREGPNQIADNDQSDPQSEPPEEVAVAPDSLIVPDLPDIPLPEQQPDFEHLIADARSAWKSLAERATSQASGFSVFLPNIREDIGFEEPEVTQPEETLEIQVGPMPLPDGVNRAFDFLFEQAGPEEPETT